MHPSWRRSSLRLGAFFTVVFDFTEADIHHCQHKIRLTLFAEQHADLQNPKHTRRHHTQTSIVMLNTHTHTGEQTPLLAGFGDDLTAAPYPRFGTASSRACLEP